MKRMNLLAICGAISVVLGLFSVPVQAAPTVPITMYRGEWSASAPEGSTKALNMEKFKSQCADLGFKPGSKDFGNCVMELMD